MLIPSQNQVTQKYADSQYVEAWPWNRIIPIFLELLIFLQILVGKCKFLTHDWVDQIDSDNKLTWHNIIIMNFIDDGMHATVKISDEKFFGRDHHP